MSRRTYKDFFVEQFHEYDINIPARTILVSSVYADMESESGVDVSLASRTIKNLLILDSLGQDPITIILNNPGGDFYHGMAIYDAIKSCKSQIIIKGIGQIMSMGAIIMQAGDVREMHENAKLMIHYGHNSFSGHSKTMEKWAEEFKRMDKASEKILYQKIKNKIPTFPLSSLKTMLNHDTILSAQEALKLGLIDRIIQHEAKAGVDP